MKSGIFSLAMVSIITMIAIGELMYRITDCITVLQHTQIFVSNSRIKQINTSLQTKSKQNIWIKLNKRIIQRPQAKTGEQIRQNFHI